MQNFFDYNFNISKIIIAVHVKAGTGEKVHRNRLSHGLVYISEGEYEYKFLNGSREAVGKNQLFYLPKFSDYDVISDSNGSCYAINFDLDDTDVTFPFFKIPENNAFEQLFINAAHSWQVKDTGYVLKCKSIVYELLYRLQKQAHYYVSPDNKIRLSAAVDFIKNNYTSADAISISGLAEMLKITPEYFRILFKAAYGISPLKYITSLRISLACDLLSSGEFSAGQIAYMCGYSSQSYFSRDFKKTVGVSPTEYIASQ